jgi:hypothetical protein
MGFRGSRAYPSKRNHSEFGLGLVWARDWAARHTTYYRGQLRIDEYSDWKTNELLYLAVHMNQDLVDLPYSDYEDLMNEYLRKSASAAKAQKAGKEVEDDAFEKSFPALSAFLTETQGVDGSPRELCRVTVFADRGRWKASLVDPGTEHSLFVTLERPQDAFKALEKALSGSEVDWRAWGGRRDAKRGRK